VTHRYGHLSEGIGTRDHFKLAHALASRNKRHRKEVIAFESNLDENAERLLQLFLSGKYKPGPGDYTYKTIIEKKSGKGRFLSMLDYWHHVYQWGLLTPTESILDRSLDERTFGCIPGRGQHMMVRMIARDIKAHPELKAFANLDVSKMYANIQLSSPKEYIRKKIKDPLLIKSLDAVIDSSIGTPMGNGDLLHPAGIAIGLKISTVFANISMGQFMHDLRRLFGLWQNDKLISMMAEQYVDAKMATVKSKEDEIEMAKGRDYLADKFRGYVMKGIRFVYCFMDNFLILHEDKTFLHMVTDWVALYWGTELKLTMNAKWQVGSIGGQCPKEGPSRYSDGFTIVGYRIFADGHIRASKWLKEDVKRMIRKGRRMGLTYDQIRIAVSSRLGVMRHADSRNFFKKYHMEKKERLGAKINKRKSQCPFDIAHTQQRRFESLLFNPEISEDENDFMMELRDFEVINSIKEFNDDGTPKKCLAIRFEWQGKEFSYKNEKGKDVLVKPGEEYYAYTGSKVLIEQTETEFSKEDLPAPTVIKVELNKKNKKFYKFT
jgi:RNA-directed DNA polymerase